MQKCFARPVEFAVLGPVEVRIEGEAAPLGGPKQRALLALLLLNGNEVVSRDRLIEGLWGERAPSSAQRSLDSYVSRLRAVLGDGRVERRPPGYVLRVEPGELDLERFEALLEQGRAAPSPGEARDRLRDALSLWRGRPLADIENEPFAPAEAARLEERRLLAVEGRIEAELELGGGAALIGELERLVATHPYRERLLGQLMLAFYRAGRQADALEAYRLFRRRFAGELGLEPSDELRDLERRILDHDPTLRLEAKPRLRAQRHRRWPLFVVPAGASIAAVVVTVLLSTGGTPSPRALTTAGLVELKGRSVRAQVVQPDAPAAVVSYGGSLWLAEPNAGAIIQIDRRTHEQADRIPVGGSPSVIAAGGGAIWVASVPSSALIRIDPTTKTVTRRSLGGLHVGALAFGLGHLWIADETDSALLSVDPKTEAVRPLQVDLRPSALAVGRGVLWVADYDKGQLAEVDPSTGETIAPVLVGDGPDAIAVGNGAVWVANYLDSTVTKVETAPEPRVVATTPVGSDPVGVAVDGGSVDVAGDHSPFLTRIDARDGRATQTAALGGGLTSVVSAGRDVWVGARPAGHHRGGTLVLLHTPPLSVDPALQNDLPPFQSDGLTSDALLTAIGSGASQAEQLVPDLAVSIPPGAEEDTSLTFTLRPNLRYSTGEAVRAGDFRRAIERLFRVGSLWSGNYIDIVGASACNQQHCDLSRGIETDDKTGTITFHLRKRNPDFLGSLASIGAAPVPPGTPYVNVGGQAVPGTGPYEVASVNLHEIRYVRNPYFHEWSHVAQPDGNPDVIVMRFGLSAAREVTAVENGKADWTADGVPGRLLHAVKAGYSGQLHSLYTPQTDYLDLNTTTAPFNDVRVRRALNLAIDRRAVARLYGGPASATPACQMLPPDFPGYRPYCPYTRRGADGRWHAPDLAGARRLVAASGTRGDPVTVFGTAGGPPIATTVLEYTAQVLRRLGYRADVRLVQPGFWASVTPVTWSVIQVISKASEAGGPVPYTFFGNVFSCAAAANHRWFCDRSLDRMIARAQTLEASDVRAANAAWSQVDRRLVDDAAFVPLVSPHSFDFVSRKIRNYVHDPEHGLIPDQAWLR